VNDEPIYETLFYLLLHSLAEWKWFFEVNEEFNLHHHYLVDLRVAKKSWSDCGGV
jgi:hypothetical protein